MYAYYVHMYMYQYTMMYVHNILRHCTIDAQRCDMYKKVL